MTVVPLLKLNYIIKKFKRRWDSKCIYEIELDKACFQHHKAYGDIKVSNKKTTADKVLHDKAFNLTKYRKYDGFQNSITSTVYTFLTKSFR